MDYRIPLIFLVGLIIVEQKVRMTGAVTADALFKNLVHSAAMLVTVLAFGVIGELAREAILLAATPSAVITAMFAEEYGILRSQPATATALVEGIYQGAVESERCEDKATSE